MSYNHNLNDYTGDTYGKNQQMEDEKLPKSILIIPISIILIIFLLFCFSLNAFSQGKGMVNYNHSTPSCYYVEKQKSKDFQYIITSNCNNIDEVNVGVNLVNGEDILLKIIKNTDYVTLVTIIEKFYKYQYVYITNKQDYIQTILVKGVNEKDRIDLYLHISKYLHEKY